MQGVPGQHRKEGNGTGSKIHQQRWEHILEADCDLSEEMEVTHGC